MGLIKLAYDQNELRMIEENHADNRSHWQRTKGKWIGWGGGYFAGGIASRLLHPVFAVPALIGSAALGINADRERKIRDFNSKEGRKQFSK